MAYKTGKKCFFCNEETLSQQKIGKKTICIDCINNLYDILELSKYKLEDD